LLHVDFHDLYSRHLGRHSQFGLNVNHLLALYLIWFGVYEAVAQSFRHAGVPPLPVVAGMAAAYFLIVSLKLPLRTTIALAVFLIGFVASVLAVPILPIWTAPAFLVLVPLGYRFQAWGHRVWTIAADMSDFNRRFPPGRALNLILATFEVPTCLYYLLFRRQDWRR
jgi:hypothetical protein